VAAVSGVARREQFEIPQPTEGYAELVALLPQEWVGPASRLVPLVQVPLLLLPVVMH
jgi:hypothetical protein